MSTWDAIYTLLGIKDFIYFISSSDIQDMLLPVKIVFIAFTIFFFLAVVYFLRNSTYLQYKFIEDVTEFLSWQAYGLKEIEKKWAKIMKRLDTGLEVEYKMAIIEADDFLSETLQDRGFEGKTFEELVNSGRVAIQNYDEIMQAHEIRNAAVYDPNYKIDINKTKKILSLFEAAIKNVASS